MTPMPIVAVTNQKGGVGKTTTVVNLAAWLATGGRRILVIDTDPQANATSGLGVERATVVHSSYDVIVDGQPLADAIVPTAVTGLDLVPANVALAGAEVELVSMPRSRQRLHYALEGLEAYDLVLIDCPPSLGMLTVNAVVAARWLLVPIQCEYYALEGLSLLTQTLQRLRLELNPHLAMAGIVMTLYDGRVALARQVVDEVRRQFPSDVFATLIPRNVRLSEAPSHGLPITLYDRTCRGSRAYEQLAAEFEARVLAPVTNSDPVALVGQTRAGTEGSDPGGVAGHATPPGEKRPSGGELAAVAGGLRTATATT